MRSPGIATLKEAFDITYAVHRMEEEGARRRAAKGGANRGFLGGLNEEDEDEFSDDEHTVAEARQRHGERQPDVQRAGSRAIPQIHGAGARETAKRALAGPTHAKQPMYDGRAGQRDRGSKQTGGAPFELDLDNATLLARRHKRGVDGGATLGLAMAGSSPLAVRDRYELPENPGSPMRID